jgi:hypothetical protein
MRKRLETEIRDSRDVMFLPEYEIARLSDTTNAFEFRKNETEYPLEEIWKAARLSGFRGADIAAEQAAMLTDKNRIVRYWAVIGLRSQDARILAPYRQELLRAMDDPYPPVAVTAAAINYGTFGVKQSADKLKSWIMDENNDVALMAVNYLLYISDRRPFTATVLSSHDLPGRTYNVKAACIDFLGSQGLVPNTPDYRQ